MWENAVRTFSVISHILMGQQETKEKKEERLAHLKCVWQKMSEWSYWPAEHKD
jgi:hypothetical protein